MEASRFAHNGRTNTKVKGCRINQRAAGERSDIIHVSTLKKIIITGYSKVRSKEDEEMSSFEHCFNFACRYRDLLHW